MERRKAITAAAAASLTLLVGASAISFNTGILGASGNDGPGQISPVGTDSAPPATVYVDESASTTVPTSSPESDDDAYDDDRYEGAEDDD